MSLRRIFILLKVTCCFSRVNESCPDFQLHAICEELCIQSTTECLFVCGSPDVDCIQQCLRNQTKCINACPCDQDCPNGCQGCSNSICEDSNLLTTVSIVATTIVPFQKAALMLNTARSDNEPMVITFNGEVYDIDFNYEDLSEVYISCGVTFNGEYWIFGGANHRRQMSKVIDCSLRRFGDLEFDFRYGACNTFSNEIEYAWLCFDDIGMKSCRTFDGRNFGNKPASKYEHKYTYNLGSYQGAPFTTGGRSPDNLKTEIFDQDSNLWLEAPDYPFSSRNYIGWYATTSSMDSVFIIGGYSGGGLYLSTIAQFKNNAWTKAGDLITARDCHGAVSYLNDVMVIGGSADSDPIKTELWTKDFAETKLINPFLPSGKYSSPVALFLVDLNFCKKD